MHFRFMLASLLAQLVIQPTDLNAQVVTSAQPDQLARSFDFGTQDTLPPNPQTESASPVGLLDIRSMSVDIAQDKKKPKNRFPTTALPAESLTKFLPTDAYCWDAPDIFYQPLFFEEIGLERYGQDAGLVQPAVSGIHFFSRIVTLPIHAAVRGPFSCETPLGFYRPGECVPYLHHRWPW